MVIVIVSLQQHSQYIHKVFIKLTLGIYIYKRTQTESNIILKWIVFRRIWLKKFWDSSLIRDVITLSGIRGTSFGQKALTFLSLSFRAFFRIPARYKLHCVGPGAATCGDQKFVEWFPQFFLSHSDLFIVICERIYLYISWYYNYIK